MKLNLTARLLILPLVFLLHMAPCFTQQVSISIRVRDEKNAGVNAATVELAKRDDSVFLYKKFTDSVGHARFNLPGNGQYRIRITSVGYKELEKGITVNAGETNFNFILEHLARSLKEVVIKSQKPLMKQEEDKTIVDPENLVAASTNGYEVLEKTPGLFIDQDGNIYISSLTPATVQINGRDLKMSAADMATLLKNLPPGSIDKIEVVRTPSAKYDASSTGGIVNVVLKKGFKIGLTGSVNAGMQQGVYGNQFIGFNLNNNNENKRSYLNLNYSKRNSFEEIQTNRLFDIDSTLNENAYTRYPANSWFAGYGIGNTFGKKWDIDFTGNLSYNNFNNRSTNSSIIEKISTAGILANNLTNVDNKGSFFNWGNGVETKLKIDTLGSDWTSDIFYSYAYNTSNQVFNTQFYQPVFPAGGGNGDAVNKRDYFYVTSDLKLKARKKLTIEAGIKSSFHYYTNITNYFKNVNGVSIKDNSRTNTFHYNENINAAYLQGSKTFGKDLVLKIGTRFENTNMAGHQLIPSDTSFNIHRTDLFPYIYLSKNLMKVEGYSLRAYLVYRRTIARPIYEQLNPFPRYVDQYLTEVGNPSLRPQFTQNYEANISVDEHPILAVGVNDTRDIFNQVVYLSDSSHLQSLRTYDNLGKNRELYLRGLGALPPGKKYFFVLGGQYNHNFYQGLYEGQPLSYKKGTWTFFTYHTYKIDKRSMITLNGFIRLKGQQQFYELTSFGQLNASINRKFLNDKLIITLSMNDIFYTNQNNFTINQGFVSANGYRRSDTRRAGINIRYNFGIRKKEENTVPNEAPEEKQ